MGTNFSRRNFLAGLGLTAGASATFLSSPQASAIGLERQPEEEEKPPLQTAIVPFDGVHQAGIDTPQQANLWLISFEVKEDVTETQLRNLMKVWTEDARVMGGGEPAMTDLDREMFEAPANLTFTIGFGERFFELINREDAKPEWLHPLPEYKTDNLDEKWNGGDLCLQICADDAVMLAHAARHMIRNGEPFLDIKWIQTGFQNAAGAIKPGETPRNLFGQLDGTVNPRSEREFDDQVWINEGPDWLRGGSAMVVRRIEMLMAEWEILDRPSREVVTGRQIENGAPIGGDNEHDPVDLEAVDEYGLPLTDPKSHVALAMPPKEHPNQKMLRRVYNYDLPPEPGSGRTTNTGLVFICYQKNPMTQFHEVQNRLAESDRLNEWISHIGSAVFVMPKGTKDDEYWGQALFEA